MCSAPVGCNKGFPIVFRCKNYSVMTKYCRFSSVPLSSAPPSAAVYRTDTELVPLSSVHLQPSAADSNANSELISNNDSVMQGSGEVSMKCHKRCDPSTWTSKKRKLLLNSGCQYRSVSGKMKSAKSFSGLPNNCCSNYCHKLLSDVEATDVSRISETTICKMPILLALYFNLWICYQLLIFAVMQNNAWCGAKH